jgi:hypothetical protein
MSYWFEWRANAIPQGIGCRPKLNCLLVAFFAFVNLGEQFK